MLSLRSILREADVHFVSTLGGAREILQDGAGFGNCSNLASCLPWFPIDSEHGEE
jgi:hypothetical protein